MTGLSATPGERAAGKLCALYSSGGYSLYRMSRFEEYDLYLRNKEFLVSENVITFTDLNGRLMALKPDVTLSIVKNAGDVKSGVRKLYYNENVYRASRGGGFREIMQTGLECIGDIDDYSVYEVLRLACLSLSLVSDDYILDISHLGIVSRLVERLCIPEREHAKIYKCLADKSPHELEKLAASFGADQKSISDVSDVSALPADISEAMSRLSLICGEDCREETASLFAICSALFREFGRHVRLDFSVANDRNYYNGIVFKGYIKEAPEAVVSGGRYDNLMRREGRECGAMGFAVYIDMLERLEDDEPAADFDRLLLYKKDDDIASIAAAKSKLEEGGYSVMAAAEEPAGLRFFERFALKDGEVLKIEPNA